MMLRVGDADQSAFASWLVRRYAKRYYPITTSFPLGAQEGRILRRNSLRMNILTSNSFEWNILRGNILAVSLLSIFCKVWGEGGGTSDLHRLSRNGKSRRSRDRLFVGKQQVATLNLATAIRALWQFAFYSLLFANRMYNSASVPMRLSSRNSYYFTAPASLTHRTLFHAAHPDFYCAGAEPPRSGIHGRRKN
jgi:hypothetical protein